MRQCFKFVFWNSDEVFCTSDLGTMREMDGFNERAMNIVDGFLHQQICHVACIGQECETLTSFPETMGQKLTYDMFDKAWGKGYAKEIDTTIESESSRLGRYALVNESTHEYLVLEDYLREVDKLYTSGGLVQHPIHPLPLLTAIGNGLCASDYLGTDFEHVGRWAGHIVKTVPLYEMKLLTPFKDVSHDFTFLRPDDQ